MKITALHVRDFKRIKDIKISPEGDRSIILIGGGNANGKSSLLDALTVAFGGKKQQPSDPVRHGTEEASVEVELDGGELSIKRTIQPTGESTLEVRDRMGVVKSPQAMLDKLVSGRFLDPLLFLSLPAKEQRATLMRLIDGADRISGLNEKRVRAFDRRTEVGRDLTKAEGELARLPEVEVGSPIDVAALAAEMRKLDAQVRTVEAAVRTHEQCERETANARLQTATIANQIARLKSEIAKLETDAITWAEDVAMCATAEADAKQALDAAQVAADAGLARRDEIATDISKAQAHNAAIAAAEAQTKRRTEVVSEVEKLGKERDELTKVLDTIDERKAKILAEAKLPVENLGVTDDGITLADVPFSQASGAEKLRVSLALAIAASPNLADVWVRDGALLDDESLDLVAKYAEQHGKRCWVERVGIRDPGVIVIRDGQVATP